MSDKPAPPSGDPLAIMQEHARSMVKVVPWAKALGFEITEVERARAFGKVEWREDLVGDPDTGVIHGGVITALLDNLCGVATGAALTEFKSMATLDLRIDYMRPATKGRAVIGEAECYHVTRNVAFTRAWAYHDTREKVIATAAGAFALNDPSKWASGASEAMKRMKKQAKS